MGVRIDLAHAAGEADAAARFFPVRVVRVRGIAVLGDLGAGQAFLEGGDVQEPEERGLDAPGLRAGSVAHDARVERIEEQRLAAQAQRSVAVALAAGRAERVGAAPAMLRRQRRRAERVACTAVMDRGRAWMENGGT